MCRFFKLFCLAAIFPMLVAFAAQPVANNIPTGMVGDWMMVNELVVIRVSSDGKMILRSSDSQMTGESEVAADGSFKWGISSSEPTPTGGRFLGDRLLIKNKDKAAPKWTEYQEFRKADDKTVSEVIEVIRQSRIEKAVLSNLRMLSAAADGYFLENGTDRVKMDQLIGPEREKYIKVFKAVDGEDYSKLNLNEETKTWVVTTASGITVKFDR